MAFIELVHQQGRTYALLVVDGPGRRLEVLLDQDEVATLAEGCYAVLQDVSEHREPLRPLPGPAMWTPPAAYETDLVD